MSTLETKIDKASQPHVTLATNYSKVEKPHKNYKLVKKDSCSKGETHHRLFCYYCCKKGHTIEKYKFRCFLVPNNIFKWLPKSKNYVTHSQGHSENWVPTTFV